MGRGEAYYRLEKYDWAKADMDRVLSINRQNSKAWFVRGYIDEKQHLWKDGIRDYGAALELKPQSATAYFRRAICYGMSGNKDKAMNDVNQAIQLNPAYADAYYLRAQLYMIRGDAEKAQTEYNRYEEVLAANQQKADEEFLANMALLAKIYGLSPY